MSILIELSLADIECLHAHLPRGSDLRQTLAKSDTTVFSNNRPTSFSNPLVCSEGEALQLLRIAQEQCLEEAQKIQDGIRLSDVKFPRVVDRQT